MRQNKDLKAGTVTKPLMRGWSHAVAAVLAVGVTVAMCWRAHTDLSRLVAVLVFGLCMVLLFSVSSIYHIGSWREPVRKFLRTLDHSNIYFMIAGTYTPISFIVLQGWQRILMLSLIWLLAVAGAVLSFFPSLIPRWVRVGIYIGMGWLGLFMLPAFISVLPWQAIGMLVLGGALYTVGALVYGWRWPDPLPRYFGFHEIFHLFVIAGGAAFALDIWIWILPFNQL